MSSAELRSAALELEERRQFDEAAVLRCRVLDSTPDDAAERLTHCEEAVRVCNLAGLQHLDRGQLDAAFSLFQRAAAMCDARHGPLARNKRACHRALATTENNIALLHFRAGRLDAAKTHLIDARRIECALGRDAHSPAATLLNLGQVCAKQLDRDGAIAALTEAVELLSDDSVARLPSDSDNRARMLCRVLTTLGDVESTHRNHARAAGYYADAAQHHKALGGDDLRHADDLRLRSRRALEICDGEAKDSAGYRNRTSSPPRKQRPVSAVTRTGGLTKADPVVTRLGPQQPPARFAPMKPERFPPGSEHKPCAGSATAAARTRHDDVTPQRSRRPSSARTRPTVYKELSTQHQAAYDELLRIATANPMRAALATRTPREPSPGRTRQVAQPPQRQRPATARPAKRQPAKPSATQPAASAAAAVDTEPVPQAAPRAPSPQAASMSQTTTIAAGEVHAETPLARIDADAAAIRVQASWRGFAQRKAYAAQLRKREHDALVARIRDEEADRATRAAHAAFIERELAVENRRRELEVEANERRERQLRRVEKREAVLARVVSLGAALDQLQRSVTTQAADDAGYLRVVREKRLIARERALVVVRACMQQLASQRVARTNHELQVRRVLHSWSRRRLENHAALRLQGFFHRTVEVRRAEAIALRLAAARLERQRAAATVTQAFLRQRLSALTAHNVLTKRDVRLIARCQAGVRGAASRARYAVALYHHKIHLALQRGSAALILQFTARVCRMKRDDDRWWAQLVREQMGNKGAYAATRIQATWRTHRYGRQPRGEWQRNLANRRAQEAADAAAAERRTAVLSAARVLQRAYRCHLARRQRRYRLVQRLEQRIAYLTECEHSAAVLTLDGFHKIIAAKKAVAVRREQRQHLTALHQWRKERDAAEHLETLRMLNLTQQVTALQAACRGGACRQRLRSERIALVAWWDARQAIVIQNVGRGLLQRRSLALARQSLRVTPPVEPAMQTSRAAATARSSTPTPADDPVARRRTHAALIVQCAVRGAAARRRLRALREQVAAAAEADRTADLVTWRRCEGAAARIGTVGHGFMARKTVGATRRDRAAAVIQRAVIGPVRHRLRLRARREREEMLRQEDAATIIQRARRTHSPQKATRE